MESLFGLHKVAELRRDDAQVAQRLNLSHEVALVASHRKRFLQPRRRGIQVALVGRQRAQADQALAYERWFPQLARDGQCFRTCRNRAERT